MPPKAAAPAPAHAPVIARRGGGGGAPPGMVTVFLGAVPLYGRPDAVASLGLVPTALDGEVVYVYPAQAQVLRDNGWTLADAIKLGFGAELGAIAAEAAVDVVGDALFSGGGARKGSKKKERAERSGALSSRARKP